MRAINETSDKRLGDSILAETFETWWPKLEERLKGIPPSQTPVPKRRVDDMVEEILERVRKLPVQIEAIKPNSTYSGASSSMSSDNALQCLDLSTYPPKHAVLLSHLLKLGQEAEKEEIKFKRTKFPSEKKNEE